MTPVPRPLLNLLTALSLLLCAAPARAELPARRPTPHPTAEGSIGRSLKFQRHGAADATRAVILIPGMGCGSSVWDSTVEALKDRYVVYAVTLAGFDGVPPVKPPLGEAWAGGVIELIEREKLRRPALVGHSLGVSVAVRAAERAPDRVGAVVAVDGLPVDPVPPEGQTAEQRRRIADASAATLGAVPDGAWEAVLRAYIRPLARRPADAERVVRMCLRSDRQSIIESWREVANDDLREGLDRLHSVPVTAIIAVPRPSAPGETAEGLRVGLERTYRRAFEGAPRLSLRYVRDSRHMVMDDQPEAFHRELRAALDGT